MEKINQLFDAMWKDYIKLNPQAQKIVDLLKGEGNDVVNDHIALRTFNHPKVTIDKIAKPFTDHGYVEKQTYDFEEKKLFAKHFEHADSNLPKVFISELLLEHFSSGFQRLVESKIDQLDEETINKFDFMVEGRPWSITSEEYLKLQQESDYGAWLSAIGYRPNHFTIFVNALESFDSLETLNDFLKKNGFKLNDSGGEIKGSADLFLEQSSTLADAIEIEFTDKKMTIPSCYFEFAKRYPLPDGKLYQGFVAQSADKIFESTDRSQ